MRVARGRYTADVSRDPPRRPRRWSRRLVAAVLVVAAYVGAYVAFRAAGKIPFSRTTCACGQTFVRLAERVDAPDAGWRGPAFAPLISAELLWHNRAHGGRRG